MLKKIEINKSSAKPIFRQIAEQLIEKIEKGMMPSGFKLPGSRRLALLWNVHRKTVLAALDELINQGWLETKIGSGTYVANKIEITDLSEIEVDEVNKSTIPVIKVPEIISRELHLTKEKYHLDDGLPDPRLAPINELGRAYKSALLKGDLYSKYTYGETKGHIYLREVLSEYLFKTRGLHVSSEEILITRGVTQALYLCIQAFIKAGDLVAMPELHWSSAAINFKYRGAEIVNIKVDEEGLDVGHLEELCKTHHFKMLYVTPHHQYPTTVILPAYRRLKLIQLAKKYGFYIFEDDYDYDFHYSSYPIMPLGATKHGNSVLYTGSFTKAISPVFRVGYLVGNKEQIDYLSKIRRLVDRQGDSILELAIAELLSLGVIQRYLRKNKKIYKNRRDYFCNLLRNEMADYMTFNKPDGGMSIWTKINGDINLEDLARRAEKKDLYLADGTHYGQGSNFTRLGFASSNENELIKSVSILKGLIESKKH